MIFTDQVLNLGQVIKEQLFGLLFLQFVTWEVVVLNFLQEGLDSWIICKNALSVDFMSHFSEVDLIIIIL